jgi:hypothetical protein
MRAASAGSLAMSESESSNAYVQYSDFFMPSS